MKQNPFYAMFVELLRCLFDAENQIVEKLPQVIKMATHQDLREALAQHLEETQDQVQRLKEIFKMLNENPTGKTCKTIQVVFEEGLEDIKSCETPSVRDACIIVDAQRIEHWEMASYGSARAIASHLGFDEIADILQEILDEEGAADEKLTGIAEGGFFTSGINADAEKEEVEDSVQLKKPYSDY